MDLGLGIGEAGFLGIFRSLRGNTYVYGGFFFSFFGFFMHVPYYY